MPPNLPDLTRTAIVGTTGVGKTVFATALSSALQAPLIELDVLHGEADWGSRDDAQFSDRIGAAIAQPRWVFDGNHSAVRLDVWCRATAIVYLDYPLSTVLWRLLKRTLERLRRDSGHQEPLWRILFDPRSLLWWAVRSHGDRRRRYRRYFAERDFGDAQVVALRKPAQAEAFLDAARRAR